MQGVRPTSESVSVHIPDSPFSSYCESDSEEAPHLCTMEQVFGLLAHKSIVPVESKNEKDAVQISGDRCIDIICSHQDSVERLLISSGVMLAVLKKEGRTIEEAIDVLAKCWNNLYEWEKNRK